MCELCSRALAVLVASAVAACGGGGPTATDVDGPTGPAPDEGTGAIEVRVTDGAAPIEGAEVGLYEDVGTALDSATTDADGEVSFADLEVGSYEVTVEPVDPYVLGPHGASRREVAVEADSTLRVPLPLFRTVTDIDGNVYRTVRIGEQRWTAENLRVGHYRNGDPVPRKQSRGAWRDARETDTGAWVYFGNDPSNGEAYGRLYNQYAAADPRGLCPAGWHVPTEKEWQALELHLGIREGALSRSGWAGAEANAGGKLKARRTEPADPPRWESPNSGATNATGFTVLPHGYRVGKPENQSQTAGEFLDLGQAGPKWTSSPASASEDPDVYQGHGLRYRRRGIYHGPGVDGFGFGVRCVED